MLSGYIYRATLGLPRQERREVAAELRAHLLDRVRQLEAEGFDREEAEHLAVKAMGDVKVTNSELLGHFFTTPLGWAVVVALALSGGGYWLWRTVPLPLLGQPSVRWEEKLSVDDLAYLMADEAAPRANFKAATLSIPAKTQWFYLALVPRTGGGTGQLVAQPLAASPEAPKALPNDVMRARVLLSGKLFENSVCPPIKGENQLQVYATVRSLGSQGLGGLQTGGMNTCTGITFPDSAKYRGWSTYWVVRTETRQSLKLNEWTVLAAYSVEVLQPHGKGSSVSSGELNHPHDYLFAVMPADRMMQQPDRKSPKGVPIHGVVIFLDGATWAKDGLGLPRPTLKRN